MSLPDGLPEEQNNFEMLGFNECPGLTMAEDKIVRRIVDGLPIEVMSRETDVNYLWILDQNFRGSVERSIAECKRDFSELLSKRPEKTCPLNLPVLAPFEKVASAIRTLIGGNDTVHRVLEGGKGNCLDWAVIMQILGRVCFPLEKVTMVPYNSGKAPLAGHSHYGIAHYPREDDFSGAIEPNLVIFGGLWMKPSELVDPASAIRNIYFQLVEYNNFNVSTEDLRRTAEVKAVGLYKCFTSMRDNFVGANDDDVEQLFKRAIAVGDPAEIQKLRRRFPQVAVRIY